METEGSSPLLDTGVLIEYKALIIELLGMFTLTYIGSWAIIMNDVGTLSLNGVALATALAAMVFVWFAIPLSGAHFNPAITISLAFTKHINWVSAVFYIMAQFLGAIVGAGFIFIQLNPELSLQIKDLSVLGIPNPGSTEYEVSAFWGEFLGAFFLMYAYVALVKDSRTNQTEGIGAAAFALAFYISIMTVGELSGAGLNPARSLAPAIVSGEFARLQIIQLFGPILGCLLSAIIYSSVYVDDEEDKKDPFLLKQASEEKQKIVDGTENNPANEFELNQR